VKIKKWLPGFLWKPGYYDQKYNMERHAPFIGEIFAGCFPIAMRTESPDIFIFELKASVPGGRRAPVLRFIAPDGRHLRNFA
jgi:hypothetical protein